MWTKSKTFWKIAIACLFLAWVGFLFAVNGAMHKSPEQFGYFMKKLPMPAYFFIPFETMWSRARAGTVNVGEQAPDFNLELHDKSGRVQLSSFRGKPVVLVFGSYT